MSPDETTLLRPDEPTLAVRWLPASLGENRRLVEFSFRELPRSTAVSGDFWFATDFVPLFRREATLRAEDSRNIESLEEESSSRSLGSFVGGCRLLVREVEKTAPGNWLSSSDDSSHDFLLVA